MNIMPNENLSTSFDSITITYVSHSNSINKFGFTNFMAVDYWWCIRQVMESLEECLKDKEHSVCIARQSLLNDLDTVHEVMMWVVLANYETVS